ncbi:hypothetical protein A2454_00685 [Candidatus Peribacteria bacterium RIFOXYC2_FULL_55_14]|nr:MAG: hypothetical protein A2198_05345 [Candidatus Peribacteria bacterium RIFOXYA1_FULL_56_14]OGJ72991.1 MAG: hypothetical protein A2217_06855 [Candidatus Peribacteria bacterium RIFOXYA2_FULL_55_28]OGJ73980.1 MAG: hypothetical protein A2384_05125 [Candidatus Peribacteria bacterium RIFOXYB1_FULL_54_35]OGJ76157.1 MAG: hypothetical protein A2327_04595 [Candidatus Peribacteria bacterium RIFOXYB2_FULL_54_17]OGJ79617.1 MAG: hypothetical protein A2424_01080 [Candidatus Peribacteria bacterium RIFOXYC
MDKVCAQCSASFEITNEDLAFYEKVSPTFGGKKYLIPPPTLCPDCRQQRRLSWRNERSLCKRTCDLCGKETVSIYHLPTPFPVYCNECWWGEGWDALSFGRDFDFSKPFFEQFNALQHAVPRNALYRKNAVNSDFCNHSDGLKDCYMDVCVAGSEKVFYSKWIIDSHSICDSYQMVESTQCYECSYSDWNSNCSFVKHSNNCRDSHFLFDCDGCHHCFQCWNLRHREYCIRNEPVSPDAYAKHAQDILGSYGKMQKAWTDFQRLVEEKAIHRDQRLTQCEDCSGNLMMQCKNVHDSYDIMNSQDCRYCYDCEGMKDCYDAYEPAFNCELQYESHACNRGVHTLFAHVSYDVNDVTYVDSCHNSSDLLGCVALRHKKYCIFNKQYIKEEYTVLAAKIIEKMQATGEWGEFFPSHLSFFAYNDSTAEEFFPLGEKEVLRRNWQWREVRDEVPKVKKIIPAEKLPDSIDDIPDDILNWAIECEATGRPFRIIKQELDLYRTMRLPIPHFHPDERHRRRMALRNPRKLWQRKCAKCGKEIQTTYAPERPEIVYCEQCYLAEVY